MRLTARRVFAFSGDNADCCALVICHCGGDGDCGNDVGLTCELPLATFCPTGTSFAPDAVTPAGGTCRHLCRADDAWNDDHVCRNVLQSGESNDEIYSDNAQCGIGNCDRHTTQEACEAGENIPGGRGSWEADRYSEQTCSDVQLMANYQAYEEHGHMATIMTLLVTGAACCTGFDLDAWRNIHMSCSADDLPFAVRPLHQHILPNTSHARAADENLGVRKADWGVRCSW